MPLTRNQAAKRFRVHYLRKLKLLGGEIEHEKISYDVTCATPEIAASHVRMMEEKAGNMAPLIGKIKYIRDDGKYPRSRTRGK